MDILSDSVYIGEFRGGMPNGYGLNFDQEGIVWTQGEYSSGELYEGVKLERWNNHYSDGTDGTFYYQQIIGSGTTQDRVEISSDEITRINSKKLKIDYKDGLVGINVGEMDRQTIILFLSKVTGLKWMEIGSGGTYDLEKSDNVLSEPYVEDYQPSDTRNIKYVYLDENFLPNANRGFLQPIEAGLEMTREEVINLLGEPFSLYEEGNYEVLEYNTFTLSLENGEVKKIDMWYETETSMSMSESEVILFLGTSEYTKGSIALYDLGTSTLTFYYTEGQEKYVSRIELSQK